MTARVGPPEVGPYGNQERDGGPYSIEEKVREYYEGKLRAHGATPSGVDWNSVESQELRFRQLARLWEDDASASVLDYGCGYGALAGWLRSRGHTGSYTGFDLSVEMTSAARQQTSGLAGCGFTADRAALTPADYAVASGVLNVKGTVADEDWHAYVLATIDDLASLGHQGFGFNVLTRDSDADRRRPDLYYADPIALFEHCRRYSRRVALLHDYPLYEFTVLVRRP
jgi:SAM-dependent methyltransferase